MINIDNKFIFKIIIILINNVKTKINNEKN